MAMRSKVLCDLLNNRRETALRRERYAASMVYSTAEDLADAMLKGNESDERVEALLEAYRANRDRADDPEESGAWNQAVTEVNGVFGYHPES